MIRRMCAVVALVAGAALLVGCSQIAAIAPVGGTRLAEVRFAAGDVLVSAGVEILEAPVCAMAEDTTVTCAGSTIDGDDITVVADGSDAASMTVTVGDRVVYDGSIQSVLDDAIDGDS